MICNVCKNKSTNLEQKKFRAPILMKKMSTFQHILRRKMLLNNVEKKNLEFFWGIIFCFLEPFETPTYPSLNGIGA